jgi:hypothetical protein
MASTKYIHLTLNSNPVSGSLILDSVNKNSISVPITPALDIPSNARNVLVYLRGANIWNSVRNITSGLNNNKIYFTDDVGSPSKYIITIPDGLYDVKGLNQTIHNQIQNAISLSGISVFPTCITLTGDESTQRVIVQTTSGYQVNWAAGSPYDLLGITLDRKMPPSSLTTGTLLSYGDDTARFGNLSSFLITSSLTNNYFYNGRPTDILYNVAITVAPNSLIALSPNNYTMISANNLIGAKISNIVCRLLSNNYETINTGDEFFTVDLTIQYDT